MFEIYCIISFLFEPIILNKHLSLLPPLYFCSTTGLVPCSATPTTFGDLRAANGQGQQQHGITSLQPPLGLQEWLKMFQSWSGPEKFLALDELIDSSKHHM